MRTYQLTDLTDQDLAILSAAISEMPIKIGLTLFEKIAKQVEEQRLVAKPSEEGRPA